MSDTDLQYPIGRLQPKPQLTREERHRLIDDIAGLPRDLEDLVDQFTAEHLETPYRPGGWTVRQVIHHLPDSHANAFIRFKLALTEDNPTIRPYDQDAWSRLPDGNGEDIATSLLLLEALHRRWVYVLRAMEDTQWQRTLRHPESGEHTLNGMLQLYAWHGRHHLAQIAGVLQPAG